MTLSPDAAVRPPAAATGPRLVHHRGRTVPPEEATLPMGSIALRYGVSVFEGVRLYRQHDPGTGVRPWLLEQHLDRLRNSCRIMDLDESCCDAVPGIVEELVEVNAVTEDSYVRIAVSAANSGGITDAADTALTVSVTPSGRKKWLLTGTGARLTVSDRQRPSAPVFPSAAKNISAYAGPRLAARAAQADGFDNCLLLTSEGLVSEAPTASVFLVEDGRLVTPRLQDAVLPSVTRAWVLLTARAMGLRADAEAVTPQRLRAADEVFLCGTGAEFTPVREVDGVPCGGWPGQPVTGRLVDAYFRQARGEEPATPVLWDPDAEPAGPADGAGR
ncbi:aminotransferase class IV [Streptomyces sp. SL13]|uniref:Aminotransferase class IV n=1 Tax=Streptantibioticus silvisoli TaxID=2705255 RepID=A0AA90H7Q9_9ACTN|nr:aminotransferase class IV [Streptantibioticus silvisoli]MDI5964531.1 aminotransferase class IV [Streptantibioticus silvisoli]MDI5973461.1 aminotransferase class IV [Streptantibioticus silvisoli]